MSMARYISIAIASAVRALRRLASRGIQGAQAAVAVGLEWTHAKFIGQGEEPGNSSVRSV